MLNKKEIKQLLIRIILLIFIFILSKKISLKFKANNNNKKKITKSTNIKNNIVKVDINEHKLKNVDKINTYIEEQSYLLSNIDSENIYANKLINKIETNLKKIKKDAINNNVLNLIDIDKINDLKESINSYKQIINQNINT